MRSAEFFKRGASFLSPVLAGLALATVLGLLTHNVVIDARFNEVLIFASGAAAAVLVLRLLVQRERRVALQRVVSEIVGENTSPEVAAMRILEALCVSQGWDVALKWEVNAEQNRLEFCSSWGAPGRHTESLVKESAETALTPGIGLAGRAWQDARPVWVADLATESDNPHSKAAQRLGMVSGCAVPIRVGNRVLGVLEFYCHFCLRENREAMASVETVAASLGQMLARSHERGWAEKLYRQQEILLNSVADGICGLDPNGLISFANPAAVSMLGAATSSLTGKAVHDLLHGSAPNGSECGGECPLLRATGRLQLMATAGEDTLYRADGSPFRVDYALTPILDHGRLSGSVLSFRDISQRYALDRLKDEFISTVSHELRTPLTSLRMATHLLVQGQVGELNPKQEELAAAASEEAERLHQTVERFLDLSRLESGRSPLDLQPVPAEELVVQALRAHQSAFASKGVKLELAAAPGLPSVAVDPSRLGHVFSNLLANALRFTPPGGKVRLEAVAAGQGVRFSVRDSGPGISPEHRARVFERFYRVPGQESPGVGLGLAIAREIVELHHGRLSLDCPPEGGCAFHFEIPGAAAPEPLEV